jgi:hypothetical protein
VPSDAVAGLRNDGDPEEGTAQQSVAVQPASASIPAGTRYDGGPEEGTRGAATAEQSSSEDSGPVPFSGPRP